MTYRYSHGSNQTAFRSDYPLTDAQILEHAPSVLAAEPHASRGARYAFIPTAEVLAGLRAEGFQPFEVRQTKCRDAGKQEYTKHLVRLRHRTTIESLGGSSSTEVPEIILVNSHDGTSSYQLLAGLFRWVCSNGLIAGDVVNDIRVRHSGNVVNDVIEGSYRVLDNIRQVTDRVDGYKATSLTVREQEAFAAAAVELRWGSDDQGNSLSPLVAPQRILTPRRYDDRGDDAWRVFNRSQENLLQGGLRGVGSTGRRTTTRAVNGVNENVRLNRALWTLMDRLVAHKNDGLPLAA